MKKVLVVDNYPLSKLGIIHTLENNFTNFKFNAVSNEEELLTVLKTQAFDLLVLALSHPGKTAVEILKKVHKTYQKLPILIICIYPESIFALRAIRMGASGYITRDSSVAEFTKAVKKLLEGGTYVSGNMLENILKKIRQKNGLLAIIDELSDREMQVMQLLASGKTTKYIASEVNLSMSTISTYRLRILNKLGLKTTSDLTRFAIENGLV
jgi:DNA-binding NarL/FixJ family response regulator